jgi:hypothetical protein
LVLLDAHSNKRRLHEKSSKLAAIKKSQLQIQSEKDEIFRPLRSVILLTTDLSGEIPCIEQSSWLAAKASACARLPKIDRKE